MKSFFRLFPAIPFALAAAALLSSSCSTVEPETGRSGWAGHLIPPGPRAVYGRVQLAGSNPDEGRFVTDDEGGLANVFVHVSRGLEGRTFETPARAVVINGRDLGFDPPVSGAQVRQKVIWRTADRGGYNLASKPVVARNPVFQYLLMPNVSVETSYPAPEQFLRHETDTKPGMNAYVCVVEHPYFGVTDDNGVFSLPRQLPPGRYTITARHATAGAVSAEATIGIADNTRVEFLLAAPGSGQTSRVATVESLPASARIAATTRAALPAPVAPRKIDFGQSVKTAAPAAKLFDLPSQTSKKSGERGDVFRPRREQAANRQMPASVTENTTTRVFKVDPERLLKGLKDSYSGDADNASLQSLFGSALGRSANLGAAGQALPSLALNADGGALLVRANAADMERIQALVEVLDLAPAQVSLDARIMEVAVKDFDRYIESHPVYSRTLNTENFNGILTEGEFRGMLLRLSEMKGARLVHAPSVTTLSGRLAEFQFDPETTLSIEPNVGPNGENVRMDVLFALFAPGGAKVDNAKPDQSVKTTASVLNGQTIMLGGLIKVEGKGRSRLSSKDKNVIMLLITPTVLDPSGKPAAGR